MDTTLPPTLSNALDRYWSGVLGCDPLQLHAQSHQIIVSGQSPGLTALRCDTHWVFSLHPQISPRIVDDLLPLLETQDDLAYHSEAIYAITRNYGVAYPYGPSELVYCIRNWLQMPTPLHPFRRLTPIDTPIIEQFRFGMGGYLDWSIDESEIWLCVFGIFDGERLVATGATRQWQETICELYVDTLPAYRGRGYANTLGYAITRWIMHETPYIAQSGGQLTNVPSMKMSKRLGHRFYGILLMNDLGRTENTQS